MILGHAAGVAAKMAIDKRPAGSGRGYDGASREAEIAARRAGARVTERPRRKSGSANRCVAATAQRNVRVAVATPGYTRPMLLLLPLLTGVSAGLRSMMPLAIVAWASQHWPGSAAIVRGLHGCSRCGVHLHGAGCRGADQRQAAVRAEPVDAWPAWRARGVGRSLRRGAVRGRAAVFAAGVIIGGIAGLAGSFAGFAGRKRLHGRQPVAGLSGGNRGRPLRDRAGSAGSFPHLTAGGRRVTSRRPSCQADVIGRTPLLLWR